MRLANKTAIVTGGASGIGAAICAMFADEGATVLVADLDEMRGEAVADSARRRGGRARFHRLDVSDDLSWKALLSAVAAEGGAAHIVVNNAGVAFPNGDVEQQSLADWRQVMRVNADGAFLGVKYGIAAIRAGGALGGSIINISSILGLVGSATTCAYTASKGAVRLLTKSAALHCAKSGYRIRVNSIHPGFIETPMVEDMLRRRADASAMRASIMAATPLGHLGAPEDIAYAALYLASDESRFVTGAGFVVDGGYTAQ